MQFKIEPYQWQHKAIAMGVAIPDLAIFADMGTGKTGALINILRTKYEPDVKRTIIFSPLVTLFNWQNEFKLHSYIHPDDVIVAHGTSKKKLKAITEGLRHRPNKIIITNYEALQSKAIYEYIKVWKPEILACDESHQCKTHTAQRSKKVFELAKNAKHRYIMTGTPMANGVQDIFQQFKILDGGDTFGTNFYTFQRKYMYDENGAWSHQPNHFPKWAVRPEMEKVIKKMIYKKAIRVTKDETLDLPPLIQEKLPVPLSPSQERYYKQMEKNFITFVEEGEKKGAAIAQLAITQALRLQTIVTGFIKDDDGQIIEIKDNPRLKACKDLVEQLYKKEKIILWYHFKHNFTQLKRIVEELGIDYEFITDNKDARRTRDSMDRFQTDNECRVIICSRNAAGIGVNLTAASVSIVYSRDFSLTKEEQSRDRNYRGGSDIHDRIVKYDMCAKGTIDEIVTEALVDKKEIASRIIDVVKENRL